MNSQEVLEEKPLKIFDLHIKEEIKVETPSNVFSSDFDITNLKTEFQTDCIELQNVDIKCEINDFDASFSPSKQTDFTYNFNKETKQYIIKEELLYCYSKDNFTNKKHRCKKCNFETSHLNSLKRHLNHHKSKHMERHKKNKKISLSNRKPYGLNHCPDCDYETNDKSNMRRHLMKHGRLIERCFYCFHCDYHTSRKDALIIHISRKHRPKIEQVKEKLECNKCGFEADSKTNLEIHKSTHKNVKHMKVHQCTQCSYKTIYKTSFTRHIASHRTLEENIFSCYLCSYKAVRKDELKNHIGRHNKFKSK